MQENPKEETLKDLKEKLQQHLQTFENYLSTESEWQNWPTRLSQASLYSLKTGGKRVRPCLAMLTLEAFGYAETEILPWALAIEYIHTYSLIHDDLPAMDNDDFRRGLPTCHKKFDEATAILAGDALLTQSFVLLSQKYRSHKHLSDLITLLSESAGGAGMVGGQVEDMAGVHTLDDLIQMQTKKTGALIKASILGAGIYMGCTADQLTLLGVYGDQLGILFQLTDDILDAAQDAERDGNSFLHHLSLDEVFQKRDTIVLEALSALDALGLSAEGKGRGLRDFIFYIASRDH